MQGEGSRDPAPDLLEPTPVELKRAGVVAVDVANCDREAVHAALLDKLLGFARLGRRATQGFVCFILMALHPAELGLDSDAAGAHRAHHGPSEGQVLGEGEHRAVGHHCLHPAVGGALYEALVPGMVELHEDLGRGSLGRGSEGPHEPPSALRPEGRRTHEDYRRRTIGLGGPDHSFEAQEVVAGERTDGPACFLRLAQYLSEPGLCCAFHRACASFASSTPATGVSSALPAGALWPGPVNPARRHCPGRSRTAALGSRSPWAGSRPARSPAARADPPPRPSAPRVPSW